MNTTTVPTVEADPKTEAWLSGYGVTAPSPVVVPLDRVDDKASLSNQARTLTPIIETNVSAYAAAAKDGALFPPIIVRPTPSGYVTIDGNNRRHAFAKAGFTACHAYVVDVPRAVADVMAFAANTLHGEPPTKAERDARIVLLKRDTDMTNAQIGRQVGVSHAAVAYTLAAHEVRSMASNPKKAAQLSETALVALSRVPSKVAVDYLIDLLTSGVNIGTSELRKVCAECAAAKGDDERIRIIDQAKANATAAKSLARNVKPKGRGPRRVTDAVKLNQALGSLLACTPSTVALEMVNPSDRAAMADKIAQARKALDAIGAAL